MRCAANVTALSVHNQGLADGASCFGVASTNGAVDSTLEANQMTAPFEALEMASKNRVDVASLWGQWPGDESIDELLAMLDNRRNSGMSL
jgi:hypothetical protein